MPETTQVILVIVIVTLTTLLTVIGIQVIIILRELKITLEKSNRILNITEEVAGALSRPVISLANITEGLTTGFEVISFVRALLGDRTAEGKHDSEK